MAKVFCAGNTEHGEMGLGGIEEEHILLPRKQRLPHDRRKFSVVQLASGRNHTLLLLRNIALDQNVVFSCGSNERLQLGRAGSWKRLEVVDALSAHNIIQVSAGTNHSACLSEAGQVFTFGCNLLGQLGVGSREQQEIGKPSLVKKLATKNVVQICCGGSHCLALTKNGECWAWGSNASGQLGVGSSGNCISAPTLVLALQWTPILQLAAGGSHSAILTYTNQLYLWGKNDCGQLGLGHQQNRTLPTLQTSLQGQNITYISLGDEHSAAITAEGGLFTWGSGLYGKLGHGSSNNEILPRKVFELMGSAICQVSCGRCHTLAATTHGRIFSWGLNGTGQLAIGSTHSKAVPHYVSGPWVEINVKDLLLRATERSLCTVSNSSSGVVNREANFDSLPEYSDNLKTSHPTTDSCKTTSTADSAMEIDELNEDDNSSSDTDGNNVIIEEPDDVEGNSRSSNSDHIPQFLCDDSVVFTSRDHIEIDEYQSDPDSDFDELPHSRKQLVLKEIVASKGDQSFFITQPFSERVRPDDFRKIESSHEIAKLDNALFEQFKDLSKESIPLDIIDYIEEVFSSIPCWNASYINTDGNDLNQKIGQKFSKLKANLGLNLDDISLDCGSIDWRQALHGFNSIEEAQNDRINELICGSVIKILSNMPDVWFKENKDAAVGLHEEVLRIYQLLPLFHLFRMLDAESENSQKLISSLGNSILMLSKEARECLSIWWGCMPKHYLKSLVHIFKKSVEFNLIKQHKANKESAQEQQQQQASSSSSSSSTVKKAFSEELHHNLAICLEVLKMLYTANKMVENISYKEFYIHGILDMFDLKMDYILWKTHLHNTGTSGKKNYFLCNYAFIFDAPAKSMILAIDSEIQQQAAAESSVYRQILFSRPIDGQIFVDPYLTISVHRNTILQDTINQLCYLTKHDESDFKKPLRVNFEGEEAVDAGQGVKREFFILLCAEVLHEKYGMFVEYKDTRTIWFHHSSFEDETMFHLIGVLAGLAIYNKVIINLPFPLVLYKKILGEKLDGLDDLAYLDPLLAKNLKEIQDSPFGPEEFDAIFGEMNFTITLQTFGSPIEYELCHNGKDLRLTYANRAEYVDLYWRYILETSIEKQFASFRKGFMKVLDTTTLTIFHAEELMQMVSGQEVSDWIELELHATSYRPPFHKDHPTIKMFWKVFHSLPDQQKRKLLTFITGSERVPILGVKALNLTIQPMMVSDDHLPVAHVCSATLDLPYQSDSPDAEAKLRSKLLKACEYSTGFALV